MSARRTLQACLAGALLLAGCDASGPPAAEAPADVNKAQTTAVAPEAANKANATPQAVTSSSTPRGCGRHGVAVVERKDAPPVPPLTGRVMDRADLLPPATERRLAADLAALERETTDQFVVVTLPSLEGESIESLGLRLGNSWGIGQQRLDNGVLLIVVPNEGRVRIEVGCGLEGLLTDERAKQLIDEALLPHFRAGRFAEGIQAGVANVVAVLRSNPQRPQRWQQSAAS